MTTQPQYTPGPWHVGRAYPGYITDSDGNALANVIRGAKCQTDREIEANAALIAAAPDLLAALEAAADELEAVGALKLLQDDGRSIGETIRAALALARAGR